MRYEIMYYVGMAMVILMFIVSVLLFIKLKIYKVIGNLTGITAKKAIQNKREYNTRTSAKNYHTDAINKDRGRLTDEISALAKPSENTGKLGKSSSETTVLSQEQEKDSEYYFDIEFDLMLINTYEFI